MPLSFARVVLSACWRVAWGAVIAAALVQRPVVADDGSTISPEVDAAMNHAARLGMPVLAVASTDVCREAPLLKRRLAGDPLLQPLVGRFAIVELRMSGADKWTWQRWQDRFNSHRRNTPQLFVIRADGKKIFSGDPPADLAGFLREQLGQSGQPISPRQADLFEDQLEAASRLQKEGNLAGAVGAVMPAARLPSHARPVVQSIAFRAAVAEQLLARIEHEAGEPETGTDRLAAVEVLVAASEEFIATLPDVARAARERLVEIGRDPAGKETVRQAQLLHRAAVAARRPGDRGIALYKQIIATHPDSPAAELAAVRLRSLDAAAP
jgi:hypothetical protein